MARHAGILGFLGSAILTACAVILLRYATNEGELRRLIALSVGAACTVSFTLHLGQILFRSASNDSTARMMAWAARTLLIVSVATVFLGVALLSAPGEGKDDKGYLFQGYKGALIVGVAVALLGERVLRAVTDRAASMLGVSGTGPMHVNDLALIDGMNEEDLARLAEERIDSVHALAFMPTPRIFFNTTYSLERICDWQDQALLIARVGRTNAQLLREQYLVRGAIAARTLAREIVGASRSAAALRSAPQSLPDGQPSLPGETDEDESAKLRALAKALGFTGINQAVLGLRSLCDDESIERLEVFAKSVPVWKDSKVEQQIREESIKAPTDVGPLSERSFPRLQPPEPPTER
jgi:heme/copper-type cytochrome/quinol oxidase subunit 4